MLGRDAGPDESEDVAEKCRSDDQELFRPRRVVVLQDRIGAVLLYNLRQLRRERVERKVEVTQIPTVTAAFDDLCRFPAQAADLAGKRPLLDHGRDDREDVGDAQRRKQQTGHVREDG